MACCWRIPKHSKSNFPLWQINSINLVERLKAKTGVENLHQSVHYARPVITCYILYLPWTFPDELKYSLQNMPIRSLTSSSYCRYRSYYNINTSNYMQRRHIISSIVCVFVCRSAPFYGGLTSHGRQTWWGDVAWTREDQVRMCWRRDAGKRVFQGQMGGGGKIGKYSRMEVKLGEWNHCQMSKIVKVISR